MVEFSEKASKDITKNFINLEVFLKSKTIDEVIIMGHSLCNADYLYYAKYFIPRFKNIKWTFFLIPTRPICNQ